ncbi:KDEL motif-containing protein 1, partial [Mucuna pruriens]
MLAELAIKPWEALLQNIEEGNKKIKWKDRSPYAFWKGNTWVSYKRHELTKCNVSYAHIYPLQWDKEIEQRFQNTKLEDQCSHRYKIYVEGIAWSVSEKYILACDSMTLFIEPIFYDFFTRSLVPKHHYWPIASNQSMCNDIKYAVDWGNANPDKAEAIGKAGTRFIKENLKMNYAKLLKFKPSIPAEAAEICAESMACFLRAHLRKRIMNESIVTSPSHTPPCTMPPPYPPQTLTQFLREKEKLIHQVKTRTINTILL